MNRIKKMLPIVFILLPMLVLPAESQISYDIQELTTVDLGTPLGQFRACPVNLGKGQPKAVVALYSEDAEIDPYIGMFFFPKHSLKMVLFDETGKIHWTRDLGPGMVPGIWFSPIFAFDLNTDGTDEIWIVNNTDPEHPMDYRQYVLERVDAFTGEPTGEWPWPQPETNQRMSHLYRHFIFGGYIDDQPILITAQGTYGPMIIKTWNPDMTVRWEKKIDPSLGGALGSHVTPVVDLDFDEKDEMMWGERCISLETGKELFSAGSPEWTGHSDIVAPILDHKNNTWVIHTCRESAENTPPRVVVYHADGSIAWLDVEKGHMDTGWGAHLGPDGEPVVLAVKVGKKIRTAEGEHRTGIVEYTYDAFSGKRIDLGYNVYTSIPVDLNGDGIHELVKGYFEGDGSILNNSGKIIGNINGLAAMASKFTSHPGEQILSYSKDGKITIWRDKNASDSDKAKARYAHPFYRTNQKQTGNGYNLFTLGGL